MLKKEEISNGPGGLRNRYITGLKVKILKIMHTTNCLSYRYTGPFEESLCQKCQIF